MSAQSGWKILFVKPFPSVYIYYSWKLVPALRYCFHSAWFYFFPFLLSLLCPRNTFAVPVSLQFLYFPIFLQFYIRAGGCFSPPYFPHWKDHFNNVPQIYKSDLSPQMPCFKNKGQPFYETTHFILTFSNFSAPATAHFWGSEGLDHCSPTVLCWATKAPVLSKAYQHWQTIMQMWLCQFPSPDGKCSMLTFKWLASPCWKAEPIR